MDLENALHASVIGNHNNVTLLADSDSAANAIDFLARRVLMHREIVKTAVGEAVSIILGFLDLGDEANLGEIGDAAVNSVRAATEAR